MVTKTAVKMARRLVRLQVRIWYALALATGDGRAADGFKAWLDNEEAQLYPPEGAQALPDPDGKRVALGLILLVLIVAGGTYAVCLLAGVV